MDKRDLIIGKLWSGRNWAIDAGAGSIHDDATASELGFRGGTVPGDVHMNQFPPVLVDIFGPEWFEHGNLSLYFINATVDKEVVRVVTEKPRTGETQIGVWMNREDEMPVCMGTAAVGDHSRSELNTRDLRPCDPAELKILSKVHAGMSLGEYDYHALSTRQFELYDKGLISDPMDWYRTGSPWGGVVAAPSTLVQMLWGLPMDGLRPYIGESVGLFGAIEIGHINGPLILDRPYRITSNVVSLSKSPKTEILWFDSKASGESGDVVAKFRMMLRFMKASSALYANEQ